MYFGSMIIGYSAGTYFGRSAKSISFPLFLTSLYLAVALFKITKGFYVINKWESLADAGYLSVITADIFIYLVAFSLGFAVAYLLCMRIMNSTLSKFLKFTLMIPIINLSALFLRLPKDIEPYFRITKLNAITLIVIGFGSFLVQPAIDKATIFAEQDYRKSINQHISEQIVGIYKKNREFPYAFDDDGYLNVHKLEAIDGTVQFRMKETEQGLFDWKSDGLNTWLTAELCGQQKIIDDKLSEAITVFVMFEVYESSGQLGWRRNTRDGSC